MYRCGRHGGRLLRLPAFDAAGGWSPGGICFTLRLKLMISIRSTPLLASILVTLSACAAGERPLRRPVPVPVTRAPNGLMRVVAGTPRDAYALQLERTRAATAREWEEAGRRALRAGLTIPPSFRERLGFPADQQLAVAYRFTLRRGQALSVHIEPLTSREPLFADLFEVIDAEMFRHVYAPRGESAFEFRASANAQYVLRLQPAAGTGGIYDVRVIGQKAVPFPVAGVGTTSIQSWFGDARDGGARSHEGVDIFAPRGTAVYAVVDGHVSSVQPTPIGGNVVWLEAEDGTYTYYYAHLERKHVRQGQRVRAGDRIGTVGNTGNARGSSPHLHFAIYLPGRIPVDPAPLLENPPEADDSGGEADLTELLVNTASLGRWARVTVASVRLRGSPSVDGSVLAELRADTPLFLLGGVGDWHRVVLRNGTSGFVSARFLMHSDVD
jgi:murein DD-endopeptidase MepM/ murein hydrolase activator NlpD